MPIDAIKQWDEPISSEHYTDGYSEYKYNGIEFKINDYRERLNHLKVSPEMCSFNGVTLDKNKDELAAVFGSTPSDELGVM